MKIRGKDLELPCVFTYKLAKRPVLMHKLSSIPIAKIPPLRLSGMITDN